MKQAMKAERQTNQTQPMLQFLITNAETETDFQTQTTYIHLWGRDADNQRHHRRVRGYQPHFYVKAAEVAGREHEFLGENGIRSITNTEFTAFGSAEKLMKVTVQTPRDVRPACDLFEWTGGADVTLDNWLRIERDVKAWVEVPDSETIYADEINPTEPPVSEDPAPRIMTFDIEVDDRGGFPEPGEKRITSIVAHDSYTDEYVGFIDGDERPISEMFPDGAPEEVDKLHIEPNERRMLIKFACWVTDWNPDVLTAWNVDFDAPYLVERMKRVGANPARLSPIGEAYNKRNGTCRIRGRSIYDLLDAYKNNSWSELRSYTLDYVAGEELGASKIQHEEGFFQMFEENPTKLINYNARDVRLAVGINESAGVISFRDTLRKQIGVTFEQTRNNYQFIEMLARRKLYYRGEVGPTADYDTGGNDYEGAFVFPPYTGVAKNVIGIDVESLYPWTMFMMNLSPDAKVGPDFDGPTATAPNGVRFRLDRDGLFKTLVEDAIGLKESYRDKKKAAAPGSDEEEMWAEKYQVSKTITNSIYGVCGWAKFFLYNRETAEAITLAGQAVIKATAEYVNTETVGEVVYGDTDSNYVAFPAEWEQARCVEAALDICERLEAEVYTELAEEMGVPADECEWRIDPEMYAPRFLQWGKKKKYAYLATWKEGMEPTEVMDEGDLSIKGSAAKRSDSSRLTRDTEKKAIIAILGGRDEEVSTLVYEAAKKINPTDPDWDAIGIPGGIRKELDDYDSPTAHVRAAKYANALCGTEFGSGSKPMRCYIRPTYFDELGEEIEVIAYEDSDDLRPIRDRLTVDAARMTDTLIRNPMGEMLDAVGVDVDVAVSGQVQQGLGAFL